MRTKFNLYHCSAEFHVRRERDLGQLYPGAAFTNDCEPELVASFADKAAALKELSKYSSDVRFYDGTPPYAVFEEYVCAEEVYSVDEDSDKEFDSLNLIYFCAPLDTLSFRSDTYKFDDLRNCWMLVEEEEEEDV